MFSVEPRRRDMGDEELRAVRIRSRIRHRESTRRVVGQGQCARFIVEGVAGTTGAGSLRTATLNHEIGDDSMEDKIVVESVLREFDEIPGRFRSLFREEFDFDLALAGRDSGRGHEVLRGRAGKGDDAAQRFVGREA